LSRETSPPTSISRSLAFSSKLLLSFSSMIDSSLIYGFRRVTETKISPSPMAITSNFIANPISTDRRFGIRHSLILSFEIP
jgi:hypothetical protein